MKLPRRQLLHFAASVLLTTLSIVFALTWNGLPSFSQGARTIKIVVPFPPGGGIDVLACIMADQIGSAHGVTVVIENRPGAGTVIGTNAVFHAEPDGDTVLIDNNSFVITPYLHKVAYDPFSGLNLRLAGTPLHLRWRPNSGTAAIRRDVA